MSAQLFQDPRFDDGTQWHLRNDGRLGGVVGADIRAVGAWNIFTGSTAITIAVVDAGVDINHADLTGKATGDLPEGNGHGTHVAGIAAARAHNNTGGRGVDWNARILSKRIVNAGVYIGDANAATKINEAVDAGAQVLNHSWGSTTFSTTIAQAIAYSYKMNRVSVAAMGREGDATVNFPAANNNVIAVGATQNNDQRSPFSNTGNHIDVVAPGGINPAGLTDGRDIFSTWLNNGFQFLAGTSMAAPQVSGLASLLKGFNTNLANDDIENIIRLSADDVNVAVLPGFDQQLGFGRINAERALNLLRAPNRLSQLTTTGGTVVNTTASYTIQFFGAANLASGNYSVRRSEVRKTITFPNTFCNVRNVWGRGVGSKGWSMANPNFGEGFCEVVPGTLTATGVTLRTYIYDVYTISGQYLGFYPANASNTVFAYTLLGTASPVISGPASICTYSDYTVTGLPAGGGVSSWSASPAGIVSLAPNGVSVRATKTGSGTINLNASITGCTNINTITKTAIPVGAPAPVSISSSPYGSCYNGSQKWSLSATSSSNVTSWQWQWTSPPSGYSYIYSPNSQSTYVELSGSGTISVTAANSCGSSSSSTSIYSNCSGAGITASPNPATDEVTVTTEEPSTMLKTQTNTVKNKIYRLEIVDQHGTIRKKFSYPAGVTITKINVRDLVSGTYIIHAYNGKAYTYKQIVVMH